MATAHKVSFTVRRPTPVSRATSSGGDSDGPSSFKVPIIPRHLASPNDSTPGSPLARSATSSPKPAYTRTVYYNEGQDSSDEDEDERLQDELVVGFDKFGVQRLNQNKKAKQGPLIIPALKDRDWRELARKRRSAGQYLPPSAKAETGADGSVGGLGVKDSINSGPILAGLQVKKHEVSIKPENGVVATDVKQEDVKMEEPDETEDQKALRAILAAANGAEQDGPMVDVIPTPISEADAYKQDVDELPNPSTLEEYARIPVSQFGAAMLRGMGWKEGMAASRKSGKGMVEPYLPEARPALLGIGAKEMEVFDDGSKRRTGQKARPEKKYIPVVKKERGGSPGGRGRRERSFSPAYRGDRSRKSSLSPGGRRDSRQDSGSRRDERDYRRDDRNRGSIRDGRDRNRERDRGNNSDRERQRDRSQESSRKADY